MVGKDQHIRNNHVFWTTSGEDHGFGDVIRCQWRDALVDRVRLGLVASKPYHAELRLHLSWVNLYDPDPRGNELLPDGLGERPYGGLRRAVDSSTGVTPVSYTHLTLPTKRIV